MIGGLTSAGLVVPTFAEIKSDIEASYRSKFGESINTEADSVFGILINIHAERELNMWLALEATYGSHYPTAGGVSLDNVAAVTGVARLAKKQSKATGACTGTNGTVIPAGSQIKVNSTGEVWSLDSEFTIGTTTNVGMTSVNYGPINALTTDTYTPVTQVFGWTGFTCTVNATLGRLDETDAQLRTRRTALLRALGSGTAAAVAARVAELDDVTACTVVENTSGLTDAQGRPGHSFECIVLGGTTQPIVDAIWLHKPSGIQTYGTSNGTITDALGQSQTVYFSRPTQKNIYVDIVGTKNSKYPVDGDTQIRSAILSYGQTLTIGDDAKYLSVISKIIATVPGIETLTVELGLSNGTETVANISIENNEIAMFDASRIDVSMT